MKIKIGVMGSASGPTITDPHAIKLSYDLGTEIAKADCVLVNGVCPGLPNEAAKGAHENGGLVFGVSPAFSMPEHINKYKSPTESYDIIMFSGLGLMERDVINIRSSDAIIVVGGGVGTLNEFIIAYEERKPIGILDTTGGISSHIPKILEMCDREMRENIIVDSNPKTLVEKVLESIEKHPTPVSEDGWLK